MLSFWPHHSAKEQLTIVLLIVISTLQENSVAAQACSSTDLTDNDFVYGYDNPTRINAQFTGLILAFPMTNTIGVESTSIGQMQRKYIEAEFDAVSSSLRIFATAALADYEQEQYAEQITLTIEMSCTGNTRRRLVFKQSFDDSNNHDPVFGKSLYTIELMLPLPKGFDLTFFQEISVRDLDIRNNQVTFSSSIDNSVVTVEAADRVGDDQKTFYASLKTSQQLLTLLEPLEFDIIATDRGTQSRSGRATIILKANPDESFVPVPVFESAIYRGSLDANLQLTLAQPVIKPTTFNSEIAFGFSGGDSSLFTHSNEENVITISLRNPLTAADVLNRAVLMTTLVANRANVDPGSTVVLVDIPTTTTPVPFDPPAFEKTLCVGSLNAERELQLEQLIIKSETFDSSITLALEGDNAALFDISNEGNLVTVKLLNALSADDVVDKTLLTASVRASRENVGSGIASFAITTGTTTPAPLPVAPRFERTFYEASISRDNQFTYEMPTIVEATFSSLVDFQLDGDDAAWFQITNTANEVTLQLNHRLVTADLTRSYLIVRVWAIHPTDGSGSTELIVRLPSLLTSGFNLGVTVGSIDMDRRLEFPQITIKPEDYTTDMQFELIGEDAIFFTVNHVENVLTITLTSPLTEESVKDRSYFRTELTASNSLNSRVGISVLIVDIVQPAVVPSPKFSQPSYRGSLDLDLELTFEDVLLDEATYAEDVVFSLEGGDSAVFSAVNTVNKVDIKLRQPLTETDIVDRTYLMTVLRAERPTHEPTATVLLVNIPVTTPRPSIVSPAFTKPLYRGSVHEETGFELEEVQLVLSTYSDAVTFELTGDDSRFFVVTNVLNVVTISLEESVTEGQLEAYEFLAFEVVARHPEANLASAGVLISVPVKECPVDQTPTFENKLNAIHIKETSSGVIGKFSAVVASDQSAELQYRLADHEYLSSRLSVDSLTGELTLSSALLPGTYSIELIARDPNTILDGRTEIQITVAALVTCPDGDGVRVKDTLLIKNLAENHAHEGVLASVIGDCSYSVSDINPSDVEFVHINAETNQLDTVEFDRESPIFADMEVPQIQVTLQLRCPNETPLEPFVPFTNFVSTNVQRYISPQAPDNRWYTLASSIPFAERTTLLTIIIEDENDNMPQFDWPHVDNQLFGYPEAQLAAAIMPPYLLKVVATDRDAGINAQVGYSLVDSNDFQVHRETGVITPLRDAMQSTSEVRLTIRATDRNGAADGLVNTVNVIVKRLEAKHITVITVEDEEIDEVDYVVEKIDEVSSMEMKVLHSALISKEQTDRSARADGRLNVLRIYAYSFDSNGELLDARTIQENLKDFNAELFRLTSATYESDAHVHNEATSTLGLIIGCAVLFALLVASILATFLLWWFKVRPYEYRQMEDTGSVSSKQGLASTAAVTNGTNSNGAPQSSPILKIDRFEVQKRDSMALRGSTTHDSSDAIDTPQLLARSLASRLDVEANSADSSPSHSQTTTLEANPRKLTTGVRFNELVERIDIEVDPEAERSGNEAAEDGDSVAAERL